MLGLKLNHVSKKGHWWFCVCQYKVWITLPKSLWLKMIDMANFWCGISLWQPELHKLNIIWSMRRCRIYCRQHELLKYTSWALKTTVIILGTINITWGWLWVIFFNYMLYDMEWFFNSLHVKIISLNQKVYFHFISLYDVKCHQLLMFPFKEKQEHAHIFSMVSMHNGTDLVSVK